MVRSERRAGYPRPRPAVCTSPAVRRPTPIIVDAATQNVVSGSAHPSSPVGAEPGTAPQDRWGIDLRWGVELLHRIPDDAEPLSSVDDHPLQVFQGACGRPALLIRQHLLDRTRTVWFDWADWDRCPNCAR
ncbi:hypothetical protein [Labedaea rhizosphaerae]|nr:hypothetical protein [Labedaea rhizosphaerae]